MNFTRGKRIALEVLGPPLLGTVVVVGVSIAISLGRGVNLGFLRQEARDYLFVLIYAYVFGLPPSLAYMTVMEAAFARGLDPDSGRSVGLSAVLGLLSGAGIAAVLGGLRTGALELWLCFGGVGLLVGLVLGWVIRRLSRQL